MFDQWIIKSKEGEKTQQNKFIAWQHWIGGSLSGTEEIRGGRLTIQCLKSKLLSFFFPLSSFQTCLPNYYLWEIPAVKARVVVTQG